MSFINKSVKEKISIKEFLIASSAMLIIIGGFCSEIFVRFSMHFPTNITFIVAYLIAALAWIITFFEKPPVVIFTVFASIIVYIFSYFINQEINQYVFDFGGSIYEFAQSNIMYFMGLCLPVFFLCFCKISIHTLYKYLYIYSVIATVLFVLLMVLQIFTVSATFNYMSIAYNALPPVIIVYYGARDNNKIWAYILSAMGFFGLFIGGCRGALLTLIVLIALWELKSLNQMTSKKVIALLLLTIVFILVIFNFENIIIAIDDFLDSFGYSSRIIDKILGGTSQDDLFDYENRSKLNEVITSGFNILGHGIFSDRIVLDGVYAHNFFYEIIYQFGYFGGGIIIVLLFVFLKKSFNAAKITKNPFNMYCWMAFLCTLFVKLMVSSSYITDTQFWFFLGLTITAFYCENTSTKENQLEANS